MKKLFTKLLLVIVIITLVLTIMPLMLHADSWTWDGLIPDEGLIDTWGFLVPIKQVNVTIYHISNPEDIWTEKFTEDGYASPVLVTGIGSTSIHVEFDPGSRDEYRTTIYFYDSVLKSKKAAEPEPQIWQRNQEFQCWQVWVNEQDQFEFVFVWEYANNNHVQILDQAGNVVFYIDLPKGDCQFVADLPDGTYTVQNYHEAGHILREFVISKP